ncbi:MAG: oligopeptide:H+ symporter [Chlamydiales bacterium]
MQHIYHRGQPKGLYWLFFTELWERFGFYMVQTILVLYLSKGLSYTDSSAYLLYGAFTSMLYLAPVLGGAIADRYIGYRQSILLGGILFLVGYAIMGLPGKRELFLGLSLVILGNGFFKPNVSSLVGELYAENDPRRDGGFTLFYMGINLGSLFPPLFAGALVAAYTYGSGFFAASAGMLISLLTFMAAKKPLGTAGGLPEHSPLHKSKSFKVIFYCGLIIAICATVGVLQILLFHPKETNLILILASIGIIAVLLFYLVKELHASRRKMIACLILTVISIGFWAVYNQTFTSLMLFADRNMSKELLGFTIDAEFTQFFNPFFIIVLSPILSWLWLHLHNKNKNPSTPLKFSVGILCMAIGYFVLGGGVLTFNVDGNASPWWLILSYFIQTVGELLISPIGLAMVTRLTPRHLVGLMMGVWFLTQSAAFAIGGGLATISDVPKEITGTVSLEIYGHAFIAYGLISLVLAVIGFALIPFLNKLIGEMEGPIPTPRR